MTDIGAVSNFGSNIINLAGMIVALLLVLGIFGVIIFFFLKSRRYSEYKCVIWERDGTGNINESYDTAGIFVDRATNNKRLYMRKANVGLTADNVPYIPTRRGKIVYLLRTGLKNFHFIKPNIQNPDITLSVGEEDVNWAINSYDRQKKLFNQSLLLQYMPFIILGFTVMVILIMIIYIVKNFDVLRDTALAFKDAAKALAAAKAGTVVV